MDFLQSCWEHCGQACVYAPAVQCEQWHRNAAGLLPKGHTKAARSSPCNANAMTVAAGEAWLCSHLLLPPAQPPQFWYWDVTRSSGCRGILVGTEPSELKAHAQLPLGWEQKYPRTLTDPSLQVSLEPGEWPEWAGPFPHEAPTQFSTKRLFSGSDRGDWQELGEEQQQGTAEPSGTGRAHREVAITSRKRRQLPQPGSQTVTLCTRYSSPGAEEDCRGEGTRREERRGLKTAEKLGWRGLEEPDPLPEWKIRFNGMLRYVESREWWCYGEQKENLLYS